MEYLDGENLSDVIGRGRIQPERAVSIALQLCSFLEAAHAFETTVDGRPLRSLLHGDLKPRNVRVTSTGRYQSAGLRDGEGAVAQPKGHAH